MIHSIEKEGKEHIALLSRMDGEWLPNDKKITIQLNVI